MQAIDLNKYPHRAKRQTIDHHMHLYICRGMKFCKNETFSWDFILLDF